MFTLSPHSLSFTVLLLICGVSFADTTSSHDPASHGLELHQELATPMFCLSSYVIAIEQLSSSPLASTETMNRILTRAEGLLHDIEQYVESIGHEDDADGVASTMLDNVRTIAERDHEMWLHMVEQAQCELMTRVYL